MLRIGSHKLLEAIYSSWPDLSVSYGRISAISPRERAAIEQSRSRVKASRDKVTPNSRIGPRFGGRDGDCDPIGNGGDQTIQRVMASSVNLASVDFADAESLRRTGFTFTQLRGSGRFTEEELLSAGYPAKELRANGFGARELFLGGYSADEARLAGYDPMQVVM